jgi:gluconolactonase
VRLRFAMGVTCLVLVEALGCGDGDDVEKQSASEALQPEAEPAADAGAPSGAGPAPAAPAAPPPPAVDTLAPDIPGVVAAGTTVQVLQEGFNGTEGPLGMPDGTLLFTETNANRILQIAADDTVSTFLENTNGSNGLGFDPEGRIVSVQTTPGMTRIGVIYPPGSEATLTDNYQGNPYGRPNDLVVSTRGDIYFTEPGPNVVAGAAPVSPPALPPAVYHVSPAGEVAQVALNIRRPNGIILSRDEAVLYVNDSQGAFLLAFDVSADGSVANRRDFAAYEGVVTNDDGTLASGADGLAIDSEGRLYVASTPGVQVFTAEGAHLGTITLSRAPQNLAFAGPDKQTLYVVGRGAAYKITMLAQGFAGRAK